MACSECAPYGLSSCPMCEPWRTAEECPECAGYGELYYAEDIRTRGLLQVSRRVWTMLPQTERDARLRRWNYFKGCAERCCRCHGEGFIWED